MTDKKADSEKEIPQGAYLVYKAQIFPIKKSLTKIGRQLDNDFVIQDTTISRYHAKIIYLDSQFELINLSSSGGTFLNNEKITSGVIFSGDIILFAKIPVMFMFEGASMMNKASQETGILSESGFQDANDSPSENN